MALTTDEEKQLRALKPEIETFIEWLNAQPRSVISNVLMQAQVCRIEITLSHMQTMLDRFMPLLERYERVANANSFREARKAIKHG